MISLYSLANWLNKPFEYTIHRNVLSSCIVQGCAPFEFFVPVPSFTCTRKRGAKRHPKIFPQPSSFTISIEQRGHIPHSIHHNPTHTQIDCHHGTLTLRHTKFHPHRTGLPLMHSRGRIRTLHRRLYLGQGGRGTTQYPK